MKAKSWKISFKIIHSDFVLMLLHQYHRYTLKEDGSKYRLSFVLDRKELTLRLDDSRTIFHLPQATDNNHDHFVPAPTFSEMVPFYINDLAFTLELSSPSNFKTTATSADHADAIHKAYSESLMTTFHNISTRARDMYHNLEDDDMVKSIFNSGKHKDGVGMKIPSWMITNEIKLTYNYQMKTSALRTLNPEIAEGGSSASRKSIVIRLRIPPRRSTRLTPPTSIPTTNEADDLVLQDTLQVSLAKQKSHEELEAKQNVEIVKEHLMAEEIEKLVEGTKNVEKTADISQPVNVIEEEEESAEDDYELKIREKGKQRGKLQELTVNDPLPSSSTTSSSLFNLSATQKLLSLFKPKTSRFKRYKSFFDELQGNYGYLFGHLKRRFMPRTKFNELARYLQEIMQESLPKMVDDRINEFTNKQVQLYVAQGIIIERLQSQADVAKMIADAIQQECENLRSEISLQISDAITNHIPSQVDSSVRNYITPCRPSAIRLRDQEDPHNDAYPEGEKNSYATDDDELPIEKVSQELMEEMSQTVDEAKLRKVVDEMLRQQYFLCAALLPDFSQ
ncbi:hypothetical protein Tco_0798118 [Tanacetum coccineum]